MPTDKLKQRAISELDSLAQRMRAAKDQADAILAEAQGAGHTDLTEDEHAQWEAHMTEAAQLKTEYDRLIAEDKMSARQAAAQALDEQLGLAQRPQDVFNSGILGRVSFMRERWQDDPKRGFKSYGEFATAIHESVTGIRADERLLRMEAAGLTMSGGPEGGWLLPPEFNTDVNNVMAADEMNLMNFCDVYPVTGESVTLLANGETSRVNGSRWGGIQGYWVEDGTAITTSNPKIRRLRLEPRPLHVMVPVDNSLLRNPMAVERLLNQAAPQEVMFLVNDAIINGNGAGKPQGILSSAGRVTVSYTTSPSANNTYIKAHADAMWMRLHARSRRNARWLHNQDVTAQFLAFVAQGTTPAMPVFLPALNGIPSVVPMPNNYLYGKPMMEVEQCPSLGTEGDVILADLMAYALGVRGGMLPGSTNVAGGIEVAMSMHLYFDRNQSAFRYSFYVDGQPWVVAPLTPANGSNTLSPFVTLAATRQ